MEEKGFEETVRLLLLDTPRQRVEPQQKNVWPKRWPDYLVRSAWWAFMISAVGAVVVLSCMLTFSKYEDDAMEKKPVSSRRLVSDEFAADDRGKSCEDEDPVREALMEPSRNVFFLTRTALDWRESKCITHYFFAYFGSFYRLPKLSDLALRGLPKPTAAIEERLLTEMRKPLDWRSSCSLESLLKQSMDKNVFLMKYCPDTSTIRDKYEKALRAEYSNLMTLNADGEQFFNGSLFNGQWRADARSLRDAQLLTVWTFGGTIMADDVVLTSEIPKRPEACSVSPDLISCPAQCPAFVYELILAAKRDPSASMDTLVGTSVRNFCGDRTPLTCLGIMPLGSTCPQPDDCCLLFKLPEETPTKEIWFDLAHHCPVTYSTRQ